MHVVIVSDCQIPVVQYGGIERMIWWLAKELVHRNHTVTYLVKQGSSCPFAKVLYMQPHLPLHEQIPADADIVHYHSAWDATTKQPFIVTVHGNTNNLADVFAINSIFVSQNHAIRMGATAFIYNGIDTNDYGKPNWKATRKYLHFLGDAAWKAKNVKGAIQIAGMAKEKLAVLGGSRLNFNMGFRFSPQWYVRFYGKVGGQQKNELINHSKAMLFPVIWHEPFGIAIIESLYFGCPVFGTKYGSLPELIHSDVGFTSNSKSALVNAIKELEKYNRQRCYEYAADVFSIHKMTDDYLQAYEKVMRGESLNATAPKLQAMVPKYFTMDN